MHNVGAAALPVNDSAGKLDWKEKRAALQAVVNAMKADAFVATTTHSEQDFVDAGQLQQQPQVVGSGNEQSLSSGGVAVLDRVGERSRFGTEW